MISRRQIIASGQPAIIEPSEQAVHNYQPQRHSKQLKASSTSSSSGSSKMPPPPPSSNHSKQQAPRTQTNKTAAKMLAPNSLSSGSSGKQQQQQQDSDDYALNSSPANPYDEYQAPPLAAAAHLDERARWRQQQQQVKNSRIQEQGPSGGEQQQQQQEANYRHFDPYSIYSDEEDVWYSEERLFEDHLEEIYNKWPLLDDDIWCKLIIMERNRRIGKAYARVPIVTIDGSHELSYDGYKLALNGFDNPDRDDETEECRKRLGKGIRIKMDNFGNILIKRLSKAGVHVKEWLNPAAAHISGASSNSTNGSSGAGVGRSLMPSRQQLIKAASCGGGGGSASIVGSSTAATNTSNSSSSTSANSSSLMEPFNNNHSQHQQRVGGPNDSAICDEILQVNGHLSLDQIYVLFDMKKFQANIEHELTRPFPDRRKLELQCFSIVGLVRDSDDILNLACWVMVINIVAIEMLNERFPAGTTSMSLSAQNGTSYAAHEFTNPSDGSRRPQQAPPSFVSIFDQRQKTTRAAGPAKGKGAQKEEDPYSMPANASSSDVRSSLNDYGQIKTPSNYHEQQTNTARKYKSQQQRNELLLMQRQRVSSRSNYNIYGQANGGKPLMATNQMQRYNERLQQQNHSSSIYSPGHMLIQAPHEHSLVPPKLPPRDFVGKRGGALKSKSSTNLQQEDGSAFFNLNQAAPRDQENIYSTRDELEGAAQSSKAAPRKTKRNRFLESLKAPLELAKSGRSASVVGAQTGVADAEITTSKSNINNNNKTTSAPKSTSNSKGGFARARNLRSLLGGGKSSKVDSTSDDSAYVQLEPTNGVTEATSGEVDSAIDPASERTPLSNASSSPVTTTTNSYNDLDIPTPDYETDENLYALERENFAPMRNQRTTGGKTTSTRAGQQGGRARRFSASQKELKASKDDLYYSGLLAHVPTHAHGQHDTTDPYLAPDAGNLLMGPRQGRVRGTSASLLNHDQAAAQSRYLARTNRLLATSQMAAGRDRIYGSTLGLSQVQQSQQRHNQTLAGGARHRSSSMQRVHPASLRGPTGSQRGDYDYPPFAQQQQQQHYRAMQMRANRMAAAAAHNVDGETMLAYEFENPYAAMPPAPPAAMQQRLSRRHQQMLDEPPIYGLTSAASCIGGGASRRRSVSKQMMPLASAAAAAARGVLQAQANNNASTSHYDMGRSSSGIYGNNSGSSSSEYTDWPAPQNNASGGGGGGYLNSIFKSHKQGDGTLNQVDPLGTSTTSSSQGHVKSQVRNNNNNSSNYGVTRPLKSMQPVACDDEATLGDLAAASAPKQQHPAALGGPAYRSYDSSNDSDPSYTNSSDGLDIYDHIGSRPRHHHHNQFLDHQLAPEIHVGEWENLYDR